MIGRTGGSEKARQARSEQGILIASGLMAGAAIFGVITAFLRNPDLGAPIQHLSVGVDFSLVDGSLAESAAAWYDGFQGQMIGLVMLLLLGLVCFVLARLGARWNLEAEEAVKETEGLTPK